MLITQKIILGDEDIKPYRIYKKVPIARTGVQKYLESELFPNGSRTNIVDVYRPVEEVKRLVKDVHNIPIVVTHPTDDIVFNDNSNIVGIAVNPVFKDGLLKSDLVFFKKPKFNQLSLGYNANIKMIDGKLTVTNMNINHLALVSRARCGNICSINNQIKDGNIMKTLIIGDEAFEVDDKVASAFESAKTQNQELKDKAETAFKDGVASAKELSRVTTIATARGIKVSDSDDTMTIKKAIVKDAQIKFDDSVSEDFLNGIIASLPTDGRSQRSIVGAIIKDNDFDFDKLVIGER